MDPEQRQLEPRPLAARQRADLLERVVAAEQEPREVARAPRPASTGIRLEQRVEDRRPGDRRVAQLGEVADLDRVAEDDRAVERRQVAGDRPQQRRLAGPVRPDDPDPLAALGGEERRPCDQLRLRWPVSRPAPSRRARAGSRRRGPRARTTISPERSGPPPASAAAGRREPPAGLRRLLALGLEPLEPRLVLVHLAELAMASIALDELLLARDRLRLGLDVLDRSGVALDPLAVVGAVVATERRQAAVAQLPDRGSRSHRGTPGRATRPAASPTAAGGAPRATRARRGPGGSSARRAAAGRGRR